MSATEARKQLYQLLDDVSRSHEPVQITGKRVAVLTDMAIKADDIDEAAAAEAVKKAEVRLGQKLSDEEAATVQAALVHATTQLKVKQRHKKL